MLATGMCDRTRRQHVVPHRLTQLRFQHRDLLVRSGVEYGVWFGQLQRVVDQRRVATIAE
jgi:hypothetical protein